MFDVVFTMFNGTRPCESGCGPIVCLVFSIEREHDGHTYIGHVRLVIFRLSHLYLTFAPRFVSKCLRCRCQVPSQMSLTPEGDTLDEFMDTDLPLDYLSVFEHPVEDSTADLHKTNSPGSTSSSPSSTQQFDIGSFFNNSVTPKQLFVTDMPERALQMFVNPGTSLKKRAECLMGILRASIVREGYVHLLVKQVTRRRVNQKSAQPELSLWRLLHEECKTEEPIRGLAMKNAMQEAMRCVSIELCVTFKIARAHVRHVWKTLATEEKHLWVAKRQLTFNKMHFEQGVGWKPKDNTDEAYLHARPQRTGMDSVAVTALGFIATWFTKLGVDHPAVIRWVQEGLRGDLLKERLLTLDIFKTHFEAFNGWVRKLGETFQSCTTACSMEMCYHSKHACHIHLHAFFGPEVTFRGWVRKPKEMCPTWKQLEWNGGIPHLEPLRGHGANAVEKATRRGLYYITMDKIGLLFRASKVWPHEDWLFIAFASITSWVIVASITDHRPMITVHLQNHYRCDLTNLICIWQHEFCIVITATVRSLVFLQLSGCD
jgi:hypothetical protein